MEGDRQHDSERQIDRNGSVQGGSTPDEPVGSRPSVVTALSRVTDPARRGRVVGRVAEDILTLQRAAGNGAVTAWLQRSVSPPPPVVNLPAELGQLDPAVQEVLHRRGRARVSRPPGGWVVTQARDERIDFDWVALLFVLHRADGATGARDYFIILDRLMIPALRAAAADSKGATPANLPNLDILTAGMWARHPPSYIKSDRALNARWQQDLTAAHVEDLLTQAGGHARLANLTDLSAPGRRDQDFAFIMGAPEGPRARNAFYRTARDYYRRKLGASHVFVVDSLEAVLNWIRHRAAGQSPVTPLGTLYLVSHANDEGQLLTRITHRGPQGFYPFELVHALATGGRTWLDDRGNSHTERLAPLSGQVGVDSLTRVFIRGCDLGNNPDAMTAMRRAFGDEPFVQAPKLAQYYGPADRSARPAVGEGLADTYSLAFPARQRVDDDQIADRLAAKYPSISRATFRTWLRQARNGSGAGTFSVSDYTATDQEWIDYPGATAPTAAADQEQAIRQQIRNDPDRASLVHFDDYSWRYQRTAHSLTAVGTIRYVHLHVVRRDTSGRLTQFSLRDRTAYAVDVSPVDPSMTDVPWP